MSAHQFTFPPPPPAPPTTTQSYPAYSQPGAGQNYRRERGDRGDHGFRGYGRGNGRGGQRSGGNVGSAYANSSYSSYPSAGSRASVPSKGGYNVQGDGHRGGYPLPSYPQIQLPQYPENVAREYGQRPPNFGPSATYSQPSQAAYPSDSQGPFQQISGQNRYGSHGYGFPAPNTQPNPYAPENPEPFLPRHGAGHTQPVLMGPPLRLGFDKQGKDLQVQQHLQQKRANPYQNGPYNNGSVSPLRHDFPVSNHNARHQSLNPFPSPRGQGQKRRHEDTFNRPRNTNPRPQAAPAVPSFGAPLPLPVKPPAPQGGPKNPRKKKRKHNQLGLTPKTEEHESSEEEVEDDADEEARLAVAVDRGPQLLRFEYRGRTSTLQSSSDITAWIEERKKRFPTKARAAETAERKRQHQEAQRAANLKRKETQEKQKIEREANLKMKREEQQTRKQKKFDGNCEDAATKAKRKVEKLRKQLEREERRAAKAEAKAVTKQLQVQARGRYEMGFGQSHERMRLNSDGSHDQKSAEAQVTKPGEALAKNAITETPVQAEPLLDSKQKANETVTQNSALTTLREKEEAVFPIPDPLTPTSQPAAPDDQSEPAPSAFDLGIEKPVTSLSNDPDRLGGDLSAVISTEKASQSSSISMSDSSSEISSTEPEDDTSSSGSISSDADSDSPDQASSRREGPERILPTPRRKPKLICRDFLKSGRCKRGDNCRFRHELPERGSQEARVMEIPKVDKRTARIGLHQRLVEQEQEKEDHEILRAIIHLGERGLLNQGAPSEGLER